MVQIEGCINERFDDFVSVILRFDDGEDAYAEIVRDKFTDEDWPLAEPGALFYLTEEGVRLRRK